MASTIRRNFHLRGRPVIAGGGKRGSKMAHSASVKSVGKASPLRAWRARVVSVHIVVSKVVFGETPESTTGQAVKLTR